MNYATEQVIQSSRYLDDKVKVTCVCCHQESFDHSGFCNQCQAPLDLSRTAEKRGLPFNFVSVLGASGAGKTVFIGMLLDILSKGCRGIQGLPNNSFSVAIQQQTINALESRRFPGEDAVGSRRLAMGALRSQHGGATEQLPGHHHAGFRRRSDLHRTGTPRHVSCHSLGDPSSRGPSSCSSTRWPFVTRVVTKTSSP